MHFESDRRKPGDIWFHRDRDGGFSNETFVQRAYRERFCQDPEFAAREYNHIMNLNRNRL